MRILKPVTAILLSSLMLLASLTPAFAINSDNQGDGFVHSLSKTTLDAASDAFVYDELSEFFLGGEAYTTAAYETYLSFPVTLSLYCDKDATGVALRDGKRDIIVYAVDFAGERIGMEEDASILRDYILDGYAVFVVDFLNNPAAKSPDIEHAMAKLRTYLPVSKLSRGAALSLDTNFAYFLPAGYRLERDVWYWNSYYYSALGTRGQVIYAWNRCLAKGASNTKKEYAYNADFTLEFMGKQEDGSLTPVTVSHKAGEILDKVTYIEECVKKDGSPLRYDVYLDIIYPSNPKYKTPVYSMLATSPSRHSNACTDQRCTFVGMAFSGCTVANIDYAYIPMSNDDKNSYGYIDNYGTHGQNVTLSSLAAIRCLRYYAEEYGYDGSLIGVAGISKGSPGAAALSVVNSAVNSVSASRYELDKKTSAATGLAYCFEGDMTMEGKRTNIEQPFLYYDVPYGPVTDEYGNPKTDRYGNAITYDYYDGKQYIRSETAAEHEDNFRIATGVSISDYDLSDTKEDRQYVAPESGDFRINADVAVNYCAAGDGVKRLFGNGDLAKLQKVPMLLSCGQNDQYGCFNYWYEERDWFIENCDTPFFAVTMLEQGHVYPTAYDDVYGYRRHDAFLTFFNYYLKPGTSAPSPLYCTPHDGLTDISTETEISVKFPCQMDEASLTNGISVYNLTLGTKIEGTWRTEEAGTLCVFTPSEPLMADAAYAVKVGTSCLDARGTAVKTPAVYRFDIGATYVTETIKAGGVDMSDHSVTLSDVKTVDQKTMQLCSLPSAHIFGAENVSLTFDATGDAFLSVYVIPSFTIDEQTTYASIPALDSSMLLGRFHIADGKNTLDLGALSKQSFAEDETVTLAFVSEAQNYCYTLSLDFENFSEGAIPRDTGSENKCYSDKPIGVGGAPKTQTVVRDVNTTEGGNQSLLLEATHSYDRIKLFNSFSLSALTEEDIGREFDVTFQVLTGQSGSITCGIMSFKGGESGYGTAFCGSTRKFETDSYGWTEVNDSVTITKTMVNAQAGMYTLQSSSATETNNLFWFDDILIKERPSAYTQSLYEAASCTVGGVTLRVERSGEEKFTVESFENTEEPEVTPVTPIVSPAKKPFPIIPVIIGAIAVIAVAGMVVIFKKKKK
jgi:hypothetical protein